MDRIQLRRDTSARWAEINPILLEGEVGYEIDTKLRKIGDGVNRWNDLEYLKAEGISQETGDSENATMSQKAITRELAELGSEVGVSEIFTAYTEGTVLFLVSYDTPKLIERPSVIKVVKEESSNIINVLTKIIRDGSTQYLSFSNEGNSFYFNLFPNDIIYNIFLDGGEDGDVCQVQYFSDSAEDAEFKQNERIDKLESNIGIEDVLTLYTVGTIKYVIQYSSPRKFENAATIKLIPLNDSTITGVSITIVRDGNTQYLGFIKEGSNFYFNLLPNDAVKNIFTNGGEEGEVVEISFYDKDGIGAKVNSILQGKGEVSQSVENNVFRGGKSWMAIGDSLTSPFTLGVEVNNYVSFVAERLKLNAINKGESGTGYWQRKNINNAFFQRIPNYTENADIITIFGSFNDLGMQDGVNGGSIIGEITDTTTDTICGCINATLDAIEEHYPNAIVGIITPTPWSNSQGSSNCEMYVSRLKSIAEYRSIPCLDLFHNSNLRPWDESFREVYFKTKDDGAHPNTLGHQRFSGMIANFIHSILF